MSKLDLNGYVLEKQNSKRIKNFIIENVKIPNPKERKGATKWIWNWKWEIIMKLNIKK